MKTMTGNILKITVILLFIVCSSAFGQIADVHKSYDAEDLYQALEFYDDDLLELSQRKIDELVKRLPENPAADKALMFETKLDLISENYKIAEAKLLNFIKTRKNSPYLPFAYFRIGMMEFRQDNFETAEMYLTDAYESAKGEYNLRYEKEESRPDDEYFILGHHSLYWSGIAVSQLNRPNDAIEILERCSNIYPDGEFSDDAIFAYGQLYEQKYESEKAIAAFKKVRIEYPRSNVYIASLIREANNLLMLRKYQDAMLVLERADFAAKSIRTQDSLGQQYDEQTNFENPLEAILYLRGEANNLAGNYKQALVYFDTFLNTFIESPLKHECLLGAGWSHLNLGSYKEAIDNFNLIISTAPEDDFKVKASAQLYRAVTLVKSGDIEKAKEELNALSMKSGYPYLGSVLLELGQIYYKEKNYEEAKKVLERGERQAISPVTTARIYLLLGATLMELKRWELAVMNYNRALQIIENSDKVTMPKKDWYLSEARLKKGIALVMENRSGTAISSLSAFIGNAKKEDKRLEEAYFWLAEANYRSDMLMNAAQSYERLLKQFPYTKRKEDIIYSLGWSYFRMRNFRKSSEVFERLLEEYPNSDYAVEVLVRQADGYHMIKSYQRAAEYYRRAANKAPGTDEGRYASFQRADALYRNGNYNQSLNALQEFVVKYGKSRLAPNAMYLMGWIKFQQGRYNDAIANFKFLIERYPNSSYIPRTHYAIADSYYNMENFEEAMKAYKTVVDNHPTSGLAPEAMRSVQQCLVLLGREDEAIGIIHDYVESNEDSPFARSFREDGARILFSSQKYDKAINEYENIIESDPSNPNNAEALFWIGKSYISMDKPEQAEEAFKKVQKKYPDSKYASMALKENAMLQKDNANAEKADSLFASLLELYPDHDVAPQAAFERALINFTKGDTAFGLKMYDYAIENYPGNEYADEAAYRLANYYSKLDSTKLAEDYYMKLATYTKSSDFAAEAYYRIGELLKKEEKLDSAEAAFMQVKNNYSGYEDWFSLSLVSLGEIYEQKKEYEKAKEIYSALKELRPEDDFGQTAELRLKRINKILKEDE